MDETQQGREAPDERAGGARPGRIRTLIDADAIRRRVRELGREITADYAHARLTVVPVLKGAFVFAADLVRAIEVPLQVDFLGVRSYSGTETTGVVQITADLSLPIEGRDVLLVEDIVDTGLTMAYLLDNLETRRPRSLKLASLLQKPARARVPVHVDYLGFSIDDVFVVGYGLDVDQQHRGLPYLGVVEDGA